MTIFHNCNNQSWIFMEIHYSNWYALENDHSCLFFSSSPLVTSNPSPQKDPCSLQQWNELCQDAPFGWHHHPLVSQHPRHGASSGHDTHLHSKFLQPDFRAGGNDSSVEAQLFWRLYFLGCLDFEAAGKKHMIEKACLAWFPTRPPKSSKFIRFFIIHIGRIHTKKTIIFSWFNRRRNPWVISLVTVRSPPRDRLVGVSHKHPNIWSIVGSDECCLNKSEMYNLIWGEDLRFCMKRDWTQYSFRMFYIVS